jgi:hypothetical protein
MHQRDSGCRILHSIDVPLYRWHDPSRRRMPPRFVPKSQGNESFRRRGRTLPTLGQFIPRNWGQQPKAANNEQHGKKEGTILHPRSETAPCNVVLKYNDTTSSEADDALTPRERQSR